MSGRLNKDPAYWREFFESRLSEARRLGLNNAEAYLDEHLEELVIWAVEDGSDEAETERSPFVYVMW